MASARIWIRILDGARDEVYPDRTRSFSRAADAAEDDDLSDARNDAVGDVDRTGRIASLLAFRKRRQLWSADAHQPDE